MSLNTTKDGMGSFSIECGQQYQHGSFKLNENDGDTHHSILHEFPRISPGSEVRHRWLHWAKLVCPQLRIPPTPNTDLQKFFIDEDGNVETELEGKRVILEREWLSLSPGRYVSGSKSKLLQHYDVFSNGYVYVSVGCADHRRTDYMVFRLVSIGPGKLYKLRPIPGHNTVANLLHSFEQA
ncbi:hypothetical protein FOZ63_021929, partial [Perkinsus olseni]